MAEYAPSNDPDASKRRSTRIVQAVPITVTGVDALGQPFRERTSTLIINCHGFKYQSKRYVLKSTWLEIEIPHPDTGQQARRVRGCVTYVQRPRTVKELFQIGVEFEIPGNVWGVAFPPDDWFPFPDVPAGELLNPPAMPAPPAPVAKAPPTSLPPRPFESQLGTVPGLRPPAESTTADLTASVARQVARMLSEAQGQIQKMAKDAASSALSLETATLLRDLNAQLRVAAEKAVEQAASGYADQVIRRALQKIEEAREASATELRTAWAREFEMDLRDSSQHLLAKLAEVGENFREDFGRQIQSDLGAAADRLAEIEQRMRDMHAQIAANADTVPLLIEAARKELDALAEESKQKWGERLGSHAEKGLGRIAELEEAAQKMHEQINAAAEAAQASWRQRLDADLGGVNDKLAKVIESSFQQAEARVADQSAAIAAAAAEKATEELDRRAGNLREELSSTVGEADQRMSGFRDAVESLAARAEKQVSELRSAVDSVAADVERRLATLQNEVAAEVARGRECASAVEEAAARVQMHSKRLDELTKQASDELLRRFEGILAENSAQLNQRAEQMVSELAARLEPALEAHGNEMVSRVAASVEKKVAPQLEHAESTIKKLAEMEKVAAETLRAEQARLEHEFEKASRAALAKSIEEIEAKATDTTHTTYESLYKSAEWYQKKVQASMQAALDKGVAQSAQMLREKAAELSTLFASELDHYSRSYSEHTQGMLEEVTKEMVNRGRAQMSQTADTTAAGFSDEAHRIAEEKLNRVREASGSVAEETAGRLLAYLDETCKNLDAHAARTIEAFQQRLAEQLKQSLAEANQTIEAKVAPLLDSWRKEAQSNQQQWLDTLAKHGSESMDQYKQRLENASNSWMVATVTTLQHQSQSVLESLAKAAELRLREACSAVIVSLGENVRLRLQTLSTEVGTPPQEEKK